MAVPKPGTRVELAHGAGGRATARLIRDLFLHHFDDPRLKLLNDGAELATSERTAISTDAFVVDPLIFPGGDIGKLAVCGTVNDVAMCGAIPEALSVAFVLEEGLPLALLDRLAASMASACQASGVAIVTGDTKVVPRGRADGVYIATTGVGRVVPGVEVAAHKARPGDHVLISGPVGDHGTTILAVRAGIDLAGALISDCAPVCAPVGALLTEVPEVRCLRDPTRGGLAAVLDEIAGASSEGIEIREADVPVSESTASACDLLGLDPLAMACEGRFLAIVPEESAERALGLLRGRDDTALAADIGRIIPDHPGKVVLRTIIGGQRLLDTPEGEPLPRIC